MAQRATAVRGDGERRPVRPARTVLVYPASGGVWTGRLDAWQRVDGQWRGDVTWDVGGRAERHLMPAERLRPYEPQAVKYVDSIGHWQPGTLLGWRRHPGATVWQALVEPRERARTSQWLHADHVRPYAPGETDEEEPF